MVKRSSQKFATAGDMASLFFFFFFATVKGHLKRGPSAAKKGSDNLPHELISSYCSRTMYHLCCFALSCLTATARATAGKVWEQGTGRQGASLLLSSGSLNSAWGLRPTYLPIISRAGQSAQQGKRVIKRGLCSSNPRLRKEYSLQQIPSLKHLIRLSCPALKPTMHVLTQIYVLIGHNTQWRSLGQKGITLSGG